MKKPWKAKRDTLVEDPYFLFKSSAENVISIQFNMWTNHNFYNYFAQLYYNDTENLGKFRKLQLVDQNSIVFIQI